MALRAMPPWTTPTRTHKVVAKALALGLQPSRQMRVSACADLHRRLPSEENIPGPWRTDQTPYLREIMDCLSVDAPYEKVVVVKGAQVGATDGIGNNWFLYTVLVAPGRFLQVMPTVDMMKRHSLSRIDPMIETCPTLRERIKPARSRDSQNTRLSKRFLGGIWIGTGANSAVGLRSISVPYAHGDEIDAWPLDLDGEGDPLALLEARTWTYRNKRKILLTSTPLDLETSLILAQYAGSDQREYWVPCLKCGEYQVLVWGGPDEAGGVKWPAGEPSKATYECAHCSRQWFEQQKLALFQHAEWRPQVELTDERYPGFAISGMMSTVGLTWGQMAEAKQAAGRDPAKLKPWVNTMLGQGWEIRPNFELKVEALLARVEPYDAEVPDGVLLITAGVDIQADRIEGELVGWGYGMEAWSIADLCLYGDPSGPQIWDDLDRLLLEERLDAQRRRYVVQAVAIDTGFHTSAVYKFCLGRERRRVWAVKGMAGEQREIWPKRPNRNNAYKVNLYTVAVDIVKEQLYARLAILPPGQGTMHFRQGTGDEYFTQLLAEVQRTEYVKNRPKKYWYLKPGTRNEKLDTWVYATAALYGMVTMGLKLDKLGVPMCFPAREPEYVPPAPPVPVGPRPGGPPAVPPAGAASPRTRVSTSTFMRRW